MGGVVTGELAVAGARLYYEVRGAGPLLLLIPTGNGDAGPYTPLAGLLASRYTVVTYDKRGYSRSPADGSVTAPRVDLDVADARSLLEHLADGPAHAFGSSSGAIVALALLERHPSSLRTLVAHEPPLASVLPDSGEWLAFYADLYSTYQEHGPKVAMDIFRGRMGMTGTTRPPDELQLPEPQLSQMLDRIRGNHVVWFEDEILHYPGYRPDLTALKAASDRLILAGSTDSRDQFPYQPNTVLAEQLGLSIVDFPGGHVGQVTHPVEFASALHAVLR